MKTKAILIALGLVSAVLAVSLIVTSKKSADVHKTDTETIATLSNQVNATSANLEDQKQVNLTLEKDMAARKGDIARLSNDLAQVSENLAKSDASLKSAVEETAKRDAKIADLENQNEALDKQANDLRGSIGKLEIQISDTQKRLAASEGDKAFLEKELSRLMAEKAELERQFNDLAVLKSQVRKLQQELSIARRLEWIRSGSYALGEQKGAQRLMQPGSSGTTVASASKSYDLNVEVKSDGSVQVIPPITPTSATNSPPSADSASPVKQQ